MTAGRFVSRRPRTRLMLRVRALVEAEVLAAARDPGSGPQRGSIAVAGDVLAAVDAYVAALVCAAAPEGADGGREEAGAWTR